MRQIFHWAPPPCCSWSCQYLKIAFILSLWWRRPIKLIFKGSQEPERFSLCLYSNVHGLLSVAAISEASSINGSLPVSESFIQHLKFKLAITELLICHPRLVLLIWSMDSTFSRDARNYSEISQIRRSKKSVWQRIFAHLWLIPPMQKIIISGFEIEKKKKR